MHGHVQLCNTMYHYQYGRSYEGEVFVWYATWFSPFKFVTFRLRLFFVLFRSYSRSGTLEEDATWLYNDSFTSI